MDTAASSDLRGRGDAEVEEAQEEGALRQALGYVTGCPGAYLGSAARRPLCLCFLMQLLVLLLCGTMFNGWALNTDFDDFLRASTDTSLRFDAVQQAWAKPSGRRLQDVQYRHNLLTMVYYKEGGNLLEEENLVAIMSFERWLQGTEQWRDACSLAASGQDPAETNATMQHSCVPGESFVKFLWPRYGDGTADGVSVSPGERQRLSLDGTGPRRFPVEAMIASFRDVAMGNNRLDRIFPEDFVAPEGGGKARSDALRSHFLFNQAIGAGLKFTSGLDATTAKKQFFGADLHGLLNRHQPDLEELGIRVFYTSGDLDESDLFSALLSDILLSLLGLVAIFLLICVHTQSLWLASIGALLVVECMPLGYVFFRQFSQLPRMSIVNCVATFVIIGIGSDMIFVLTDAWRQSAQTVLRESEQKEDDDEELEHFDRALLNHERHLQRRLAWVYQNAGVSCLTTGLCGASSFLVNLMSVLMPLREFGLFMGLCCIFAVILELVMFPLALVARERWQFRKHLLQEEKEREDGSAFTGVVVPVGAQVAPSETVGSDALSKTKGRSILVRFFAGFWSEFVAKFKKWVLASFAVLSLISVVGIATSLKVDGSSPVIYPAAHNQVLGAQVLGRFKAVASVSATPALEEAYVCHASTDLLPGKADLLTGCGSFISINYCNNNYEGTMRNQCATACGFDGYCLLSWCAVDEAPNISQTEPGRCDCYQNDTAEAPPSSFEGILRFETTIVGYSQEAWQTLEPHIKDLWLEMTPAQGSGEERQFSYKRSLADRDLWQSVTSLGTVAIARPPLVQQHWRSGSLSSWRSFQAQVFSVRTVPTGSTLEDSELPEKVISQQCFCDGIQPCSAWSAQGRSVYPGAGPAGATWSPSVDVLQGATRRLEDGRAEDPLDDELPGLGQDIGPRRLQATSYVEVVWGLKVRELGPFDLFVQSETEQLWSWDHSFDPADPWAQRSIMRVVERMPEDLRVVASKTFIQDFETWLLSSGLEYPARNFHSSATSFLDGPGNRYAGGVLRDENDRVVALKMGFSIAVTFSDGLASTSGAMRAWNRYLTLRNEVASLGANQAFHVSSLWVNVEAQDGILRSTITTITSAIAIGYVAAVVFTQDFVLSLFPMVSVLLTVLALLFTMVGVLQWPFGPVDVISLIVFLGYMFTFNLHVAQYYNHAKLPPWEEKLEAETLEENAIRRRQEERFCRVNHALVSIGQSLICSAGTTTASAVFLLCCILQFFVKFGGVILAVTALSILHSLLFLPCLLLTCGPTSESCSSMKKLMAKLREKLAPPKEEVPAIEDGPGDVVMCDEPVPLPPPSVSPPPEPEDLDALKQRGSYVRQLDSHEEEV